MAAAADWGARIGLVTAAAVILAVLTAISLGLPDPWWAAISAWRVADARPEATLTRGLQRIIGTVLGGVLGYLLIGLAVGMPVAQALLIAGAAATCTWYRYASPRWSYAWTLGGVTLVLVMVEGIAAPQGLFDIARARIEEILCGVVVASAVVVLLSGRQALDMATTAPAPPDTTGLGRVALLAALAVLLVVLLWDIFDLPFVTQMAIGVVIVIDRDAIALRRRGAQRLLGCAVGGLYGIVMVGIGLDSLLLWAVALGAGVFLFSRLALGTGPYAYFGVQGGFAVLTTLIVGDGPPATLVPVLERFAGNAIGVAIIVTLALILARGTAPAMAGSTPTASAAPPGSPPPSASR
ncbi:MAG: FUSC family protein [Acetobacteraceae bacterium]|nr:FUSC family protein [Acetobacteraceae bacterium]